jgi:hypothetical protein
MRGYAFSSAFMNSPKWWQLNTYKTTVKYIKNAKHNMATMQKTLSNEKKKVAKNG